MTRLLAARRQPLRYPGHMQPLINSLRSDGGPRRWLPLAPVLRKSCWAIACLLPAMAAAQQVADTVHTLDFKRGERAVSINLGTLDPRSGSRTSEGQFGISLGVTSHWRTKLTAEYERGGGEGTRLDAIEWENRFRLTPPDSGPVAVGWLTEIEWAKDRNDGYRIKFGPLLQAIHGKMQWNANLLFERHLGESPSRETEFLYQWQAKYDWSKHFQFGLQGLGETGKWDDWASREEQSHRFGPAIFGELPLGKETAIKYSAAYIGDYSGSARSDGLKLQIEYGF